MTKDLTPLAVAKLKDPGTFRVRKNLYIQIGEGRAKSWICRYSFAQRPRTLGIGAFDLVSLDEAIEETMRAMDDLVRQGKVRYLGCSNTPAWLFVQAQWTARTNGGSQFITCQDEYSLVNRNIEKELAPAAKAHGASFLPFYPLASGLLTGKYRPDAPPPPGSRFAKPERYEARFMTDRTREMVEALRNFAETRGHTLLELAMSWLACQPHVGSIIAGATSPAQVESNVAAASWALGAEDLAEIDRITK